MHSLAKLALLFLQCLYVFAGLENWVNRPAVGPDDTFKSLDSVIVDVYFGTINNSDNMKLDVKEKYVSAYMIDKIKNRGMVVIHVACYLDPEDMNRIDNVAVFIPIGGKYSFEENMLTNIRAYPEKFGGPFSGSNALVQVRGSAFAYYRDWSCEKSEDVVIMPDPPRFGRPQPTTPEYHSPQPTNQLQSAPAIVEKPANSRPSVGQLITGGSKASPLKATPAKKQGNAPLKPVPKGCAPELTKLFVMPQPWEDRSTSYLNEMFKTIDEQLKADYKTILDINNIPRTNTEMYCCSFTTLQHATTGMAILHAKYQARVECPQKLGHIDVYVPLENLDPLEANPFKAVRTRSAHFGGPYKSKDGAKAETESEAKNPALAFHKTWMDSGTMPNSRKLKCPDLTPTTEALETTQSAISITGNDAINSGNPQSAIPEKVPLTAISSNARNTTFTSTAS